MSLNSFRELLIKKAGESQLENLIYFIREEMLADMVIESLEKMANAKHKGDSANVPVRDFGVEMDPETEPNMIHDALSHHASHYKAAIGAGRKDLANQHAKQIFRLTDLAQQAQKHSQGKLHIEATPVQPWERQGNTKQLTADSKPVQEGNRKIGDFVTNTKGWRYRGNNHDFLQGAPHESYSDEVRKHGNNKAYPLEQMRVNGKHLDIKDIPADELKGYKEHPFDKHPIMSHFEDPASKRSPEADAQYRKQHEEYQTSPHMDEYFDKHAAMEAADPEGYAARGSKPSDPVHADIPGLDTSKKGAEKPAAKEKADTASESPEDKMKAIDSLNLPDHVKDGMKQKLGGGNVKKRPAAAPEKSNDDKLKAIDSLNVPDHIKDAMRKQVTGG